MLKTHSNCKKPVFFHITIFAICFCLLIIGLTILKMYLTVWYSNRNILLNANLFFFSCRANNRCDGSSLCLSIITSLAVLLCCIKLKLDYFWYQLTCYYSVCLCEMSFQDKGNHIEWCHSFMNHSLRTHRLN